MKYSTRFIDSALSELRKLPRQTAIQILRKLADLEHDPYGFHATAMVGSPEHRRLRVGDHRVLYTVDGGQLIVLVIRIGYRSEVYRDRG
ncbi:type II toxin-antitoxin system RelE/ParE family toxin [Kitasatospora sp. NPDC008115]|uniref:type II toxin-antitoxin system RelE family toxin n=1 Tax=Kitasatospora sp. NPDC008115 TaxID=3364022 RepID=UPI0036E40848